MLKFFPRNLLNKIPNLFGGYPHIVRAKFRGDGFRLGGGFGFHQSGRGIKEDIVKNLPGIGMTLAGILLPALGTLAVDKGIDYFKNKKDKKDKKDEVVKIDETLNALIKQITPPNKGKNISSKSEELLNNIFGKKMGTGFNFV